MESKISLKLTHLDLEPANKPPIKIVYEIKRDAILKDFIKKLENFVSSSH